MAKIQRFFIEGDLEGGKNLNITDAEFVHQVFHVFRMKAGENIMLLNNTDFEFLSEIESLNKKEVNVKVLNKKEVVNLCKSKITLFASLIKKDKFEWVLEKCTELGVYKFAPIISERSEKKGLNIERARKIIKEASEQSERGVIPEISEPTNLSDAINDFEGEMFALHLSGEEFKEEEIKENKNIGILIGPEGGWGELDLEIFKENNIPLINLGPQVLRAETASIATISKILL